MRDKDSKMMLIDEGLSQFEEKRLVLILLYEKLKSLREEVQGCTDYKIVLSYSKKIKEIKQRIFQLSETTGPPIDASLDG